MCSPGRWPPSLRKLPVGKIDEIRSLTHTAFENAVKGHHDDPMGFMLKVAAGRVTQDPFGEAALQDLRLGIHKVLGMSASRDMVAEGQTFRLELMAELLKACEDPDWEFFLQLGEWGLLGGR